MKALTQFSLKEKIGQMVVVRASGHLFDEQRLYPKWEAENNVLQSWLKTLNLGGVILLGGSAAELTLRIQHLQKSSKIPLFIAADIEEGVGQRFSGASWFPPPMALGEIAKTDLSLAVKYATQMGTITAQEAEIIGINWLLAPVVDVNNNPENPVINIRAFSDQPEIVSQLAKAFIEGAQSYRVLTTAKHFPGHGNTTTDSHLDLPVIPHTLADLEQIELPPFIRAIAAKVDSIMTAHLKITVWDRDLPATLSPQILTGQLREKLGFSGLIVTDALVMGGITQVASPGEIAVRAIEAGADILLMPSDPVVAIDAVYQAVQSGRLTEARINESFERILSAKGKLFPDLTLNLSQSENLTQLTHHEGQKTVNAILENALKTGGKLPLNTPENYPVKNLIVVDDLLNCSFLNFQSPSVVIPKKLGYQLQLVDQTTLDLIQPENGKIILQIFIRGNPFRGKAGLSETAQKVYQNLLKKDLIEALIIYGSPYVLEWFMPQIPQYLPCIFSYGQMQNAQKIACQILFGLSESYYKQLVSEKFVD